MMNYNEQKDEKSIASDMDNRLSTSHLLTITISTICNGLFFAFVIWVIAIILKAKRSTTISSPGLVRQSSHKAFQKFSNQYALALILMCIVDGHEYFSHYQLFFGPHFKWHGKTWYISEENYVSVINEYGRTLKTGIILALGMNQLLSLTNVCSGNGKILSIIKINVFILISAGYPTAAIYYRIAGKGSTILNSVEMFIVPTIGSLFLLTMMILLHSNGGVCKGTFSCCTLNSKLENLDDMVAINKVLSLCLIVMFVHGLECLLIEELSIFGHISYSSGDLLNLLIDHLNRQVYPLAYIFIVLKNVQAQRILTCFNLHNRFPYLHDQNLTDYEGCLIPPDDIASESAHYISKDDTLSLTNFAIMDEDDEGDFSVDNQSDEGNGIHMDHLGSSGSRYTRLK